MAAPAKRSPSGGCAILEPDIHRSLGDSIFAPIGWSLNLLCSATVLFDQSSMPSQKRDDFTAATKRLLGQRVSYAAPIPIARFRGRSERPKVHDGVVNLGVAAHITAAAPGGARYDKSLSPNQQRSPDNGIWMCVVHGKAIDSDETSFEVETLRKWKQDAETNSLLQVWTPAARPGELIEPELDIPEASILRTLGLPPMMVAGQW